MCGFAPAHGHGWKRPFIDRASGIYALGDPPDWAEDDSDVAQKELIAKKLAGSLRVPVYKAPGSH